MRSAKTRGKKVKGDGNKNSTKPDFTSDKILQLKLFFFFLQARGGHLGEVLGLETGVFGGAKEGKRKTAFFLLTLFPPRVGFAVNEAQAVTGDRGRGWGGICYELCEESLQATGRSGHTHLPARGN